MRAQKLENYLRTYRKQSGLTQREVAFLLGCETGAQVSRYERRRRLPPLRTALAFEAIFGVPVERLFAGIRETVGANVEERIERLGTELQKQSAKGSQAQMTAQKLCWLTERRDRDTVCVKPQHE